MFKYLIMFIGFILIAGAGYAQEAVEAAFSIPLPPEDLPWWAGIASRVLGRFPEISGWLVFGFVMVSGILSLAEDILKSIADKTGNETAKAWLAPVHALALWTSKILEWINKPKILPRKKE